MNMNMKQPIVMMAAAVALSWNVQAQSLEDGIKMYQYERYQSAEKILTPLATDARANYYLGLSQLQAGNTAAAKATFAKFGDDAANMAGMARVSFVENNVAAGMQLAKAVADKAKRKDWEPLKYAADAITYTEGGDINQAIAWYKEALAVEDNPGTHIALGDAYRKTGGSGGGQAMTNYETVTGKDPKNSLAFSRIGALWYAARNYDLALENYNKAKEADPANPLPYRDLADAYTWTGKYDLAKQNIELYLERSDKTVEDQIKYADILYLSKNYPAAITKMNELIGGGTNKPRFYGILAYSQMETGDTANALINVRKYFALQEPKKIKWLDYVNHGKILLMNSMEDSAESYFARGVALDTAKDKSEVYRQIADAYKDNIKSEKGYARAGEWYGRAVAENPDAPALDYYYWGFWSYYGKKFDTAATAFERMEAKYADQPSATYWRGRVAAAGDEDAKTGAAVPHYTKWLGIEQAGYEKKNADLMQAYQYLAYYYYNKKDVPNTNIYLDKITAIEPNNEFVKQIRAAQKS